MDSEEIKIPAPEPMPVRIQGYEIERLLGKGGMAEVYLARHLGLQRTVALKVLNISSASGREMADRFLSEARTAASLSHPHIVTVYDVGQSDKLYYIAMEYLPGGSLKDRIQNKGSLEPDGEALSILTAIAQALGHAHKKGFIHRDIKPDNILFREDGTPVLSDFGVARGLRVSSQLTQVGMSVGTPHYMSPEQARGKELDGRSDLYALGIVLFEMLTGQQPYQGEDSIHIAIQHVQEPIPELPAVFPQRDSYQAMIYRMLAKDPAERPQDAEALQRAVEEILTGQADLSWRPTSGTTWPSLVSSSGSIPVIEVPLSSAPPRGAQNRTLLILVSTLVLLILTTILVFYLKMSGKPEKSWDDTRPVEELGAAGTEGGVREFSPVVEDPTDPQEESTQLIADSPVTSLQSPDQLSNTSIQGQIDMVRIPGGTFRMGWKGGNKEERPDHQVTLKSFYMSKTEVTQAQWQAVMTDNPAKFRKGLQYPVENVSWNDCQVFIKKLNAMTGKKYRLPTEAEWEYAARGKEPSGRYGEINEIAWHSTNSKTKSTQAVGRKKPNRYGLYDMIGNVWEWCHDWYGPYSKNKKENPKGPAKGAQRTLRGGGWDLNPVLSRASYRIGKFPDYRSSTIGFRLASDANPGKKK